MPLRIQALIIDPQNSFCKKIVDESNPDDLLLAAERQQSLHNGELCVPHAWEDMERVSNLIDRLGSKLDDIKVTLDSHRKIHIAHPCWFKTVNSGRNPLPFTIMRTEGGRIFGKTLDFTQSPPQFLPEEEYTTTRISLLNRTVDYLQKLAEDGKYSHTIWPYHCLIGTAGHNIVDPLFNSLANWEIDNFAEVDYTTKGSNPFSEHFSGVKAQVPDPKDMSTQMNERLVKSLMEADEILIAGEALSHCLASTVSDIAEFNPEFISRCVLLTDGTSSVPGFEQQGQDFIDRMVKDHSLKTTTCADYLAV